MLRLMLLSLIGCTEAQPDKLGTVDTANAPGSGSLSVLSYNVHGLPSIITGDDTPGRMAQIAPLLQDWDIVGIQEDWIADNHSLLLQDAAQLTQLWFDEPLEAARVYGSGLSLLSDYPVSSVQNTHYTDCSGLLDGSSDCLASKGFQRVRLQLGAAQIDVYNTHLEAGGGDEDNAARTAQVSQLIDALGTDSADRAVIFTGDFNLRPSDPTDLPELERLQSEGGLSDVCTALDCSEPDHIDRIFFRSSETVQLSPVSWANLSEQFSDDALVNLSDHPPISAELSWKLAD
jgi:endonuclease/exonuclease/phosphatase family metal-dependent hydrolase